MYAEAVQRDTSGIEDIADKLETDKKLFGDEEGAQPEFGGDHQEYDQEEDAGVPSPKRILKKEVP